MRIGRCSRCDAKEVPVNICTLRTAILGEYCEHCFHLIDHDEPHRNLCSASSRGNHNDPGFDNAIRAYEEDR